MYNVIMGLRFLNTINAGFYIFFESLRLLCIFSYFCR